MQGESIHVEFSFTGISRDIFRSILEWMWEAIQPAFPIITGEWSVVQTVYFSAAIAGVALTVRLIRYLSEGGGYGEREPAGLADTTSVISARSQEHARPAMISSHTHTGAATAPDTSGVSNEVSKVASLVLLFTHRSLTFISRMELNYLLLSLLIFVFFGTGDLQLLQVVFGIGG